MTAREFLGSAWRVGGGVLVFVAISLLLGASWLWLVGADWQTAPGELLVFGIVFAPSIIIVATTLTVSTFPRDGVNALCLVGSLAVWLWLASPVIAEALGGWFAVNRFRFLVWFPVTITLGCFAALALRNAFRTVLRSR